LKPIKQFAAVVVLAALAAAVPALAQQSRVYREGNAWVEEVTGTITDARQMKVQTDVGSVQVQGGGQNEIQYVIKKRSYTGSEEEARRNFEHFKITAARRGDMAVFEGNSEGRSHKFNADFIFNVPRELSAVKIETEGGGVNVRNISGTVSTETGGGAINLDQLGGPATAETGGGAINVGTTWNDLHLETGGGAINVNSVKGKLVASTGGGSISVGSAGYVSAETGGGGIDIHQCSGDVKAETGGGSISVSDVANHATLETGGGSIRLSGAKGPVHAETGGGSIELWKLMQGVKATTGAGTITAEFLGNNGSGASMLETSTGDVIVYLSPDVHITVHATIETSMGHKIRSDFPELKITSEGEGYGPKTMYAEGSLNGGGPELKIVTNLGNIEFRKAGR
jgi:DUF4097 and DUF4098 domain-containing protein YvlB